MASGDFIRQFCAYYTDCVDNDWLLLVTQIAILALREFSWGPCLHSRRSTVKPLVPNGRGVLAPSQVEWAHPTYSDAQTCMHVSICVYVCLSFFLSSLLSPIVSYSVHPSIHLSAYPPVHLVNYLLNYLSTYLSVYLTKFSILCHFSIYLSACFFFPSNLST